MTEFGSFDNSACERVLDLLEPGDLRLGQVVIKRVAIVKLGVNNGSGDGGGCFGIEIWTDTAKLANMVIARFGDRFGDLQPVYLVRLGRLPSRSTYCDCKNTSKHSVSPQSM